jgi:GT2 family glycosyltransferase
VKLSIIVLCWNDKRVIADCLKSIFGKSHSFEFEVLVSDNGSTDGSIQFVREQYPEAIVLENRDNLGFARGNNVGLRASRGEYVLILNPDTIIHEGSLDEWIAFADLHPEAGAFGCLTVNPDGSYQPTAWPFPTLSGAWVAALGLRWLARVSERFTSDVYVGWHGESERSVDWQAGCCLLCRRNLVIRLGGLDERFFYYFEEVDLCRRIWDAGFSVLFTPRAVITHLGGQSTGRFPIRFEIEKCRNEYRYFYKHFGIRGALGCRQVTLARLRLRKLLYGWCGLFRSNESMSGRLEMYRVLLAWHRGLDPIAFIRHGIEPNLGYEPLAPSPNMMERAYI